MKKSIQLIATLLLPIIGGVSKKKFIIKGKNENYQRNYHEFVERAMVQH